MNSIRTVRCLADMRNNYETAVLSARPLFLEWDQESMLRRTGCSADAENIYIRFLNAEYSIERSTGAVLRSDGSAAAFGEVMAIYDFFCRKDPIPEAKGVWKAAHALSYAGAVSPGESSLSAKTAAFLQDNIQYLADALDRMKKAYFPIGDHAIIYSVFDCMEAVFQFWEGDDEFPPAVRFLWDETAPHFLKFETLWYVMGCFEEQLVLTIEQIKNA